MSPSQATMNGIRQPNAAASALEEPKTDFTFFTRFGWWLVVGGFGGFVVWASLAPLDGAVPAPGVVAVESNRKKIDHPNGGVIERILVREGQRVAAGDDLIILNEAQASAALNSTQSQWYTALATLARLKAERDGAAAVAFPKALTEAATDEEVASLLQSQNGLFRSRRTALAGELRIIRESTLGLEKQLAALSSLRAGREKQVELFNEQMASFQKLKAHGFVSRNYLVEVERQLAEVQSRQSEDMSNIASINAKLAEFRMRGAQREIEFRSEVETQIAEMQRDAAMLGEKLSAQRDTVERLAIKAPVAGTVVDLAFHTLGGVIKPGDRIMDVVPGGDDLIIEAKVSPQYIDRLHAGLPADVHFDAYSSHIERPVVSGRVEVVSADALTDPRTGDAYYTMRVTVSADEAKTLGDLTLQPGMQSTVMVKTGEASLMVYLLRPLLRRFTSAMTE